MKKSSHPQIRIIIIAWLSAPIMQSSVDTVTVPAPTSQLNRPNPVSRDDTATMSKSDKCQAIKMDPLMPSPNLSISYKHSTSHHLKSYLWKETETVCFVPSPSRFTAEIVLLSTLDTRNLICTWQGRGSLACMATTRRSGAQRALQPNDQVYVPDHGIEPIIFPLRVQIDFLG